MLIRRLALHQRKPSLPPHRLLNRRLEAHPVSLNEFTWRLPRSRYTSAPVLVSGNATVTGTDPTFWLVQAGAGTQLVFTAQPSS